jgi:hypothetical protein
MADNPWAGIQNLGAIDQKLYHQPKKETQETPPPSPVEDKPVGESKPAEKAEKQVEPTKQEVVDRKERQLNAWITAAQNDTLDRLYFRLRANGVKLKKGELVGVAIEVLATILDDHTPQEIDASLLDSYLANYEKTKQKKIM